MAKSADQSAKKWLAAMQSTQAQNNYTAGVSATTVNPMAAAAAAIPLYLQRVQDAVNSGRMASKLNSIPMDVWKQGCLQKGAQRLSSGAQAASPKVIAHFQKWTPIYQQASAAAKALPKGDTAAALARVAAVIQVLKQAAGKTA